MRRLTASALLIGLVVCLGGAPPAPAATPKKCGSFTYRGDRIVVSKSGPNLTCTKAKRLIRDFRGGGRKFKKHTTDGTVAGTYYTNTKAWPGWKCFEGSGGGACTKGKRTAGYEIPPPG